MRHVNLKILKEIAKESDSPVEISAIIEWSESVKKVLDSLSREERTQKLHNSAYCLGWQEERLCSCWVKDIWKLLELIK